MTFLQWRSVETCLWPRDVQSNHLLRVLLPLGQGCVHVCTCVHGGHMTLPTLPALAPPRGLAGSTGGVKGHSGSGPLETGSGWAALPQQLPAGAHPTSETQAVAFLGHNRAGHTRS